MEIDGYITAQHRKKMGYAPDVRFVDFAGAVQANPDLLTQAKEELTRLEGLRAADVFKRDYESRARHAALESLIKTTEGGS